MVAEGPGSSEERNKVEDWESKVLGSESAKEETRKGHSDMMVRCKPKLHARDLGRRCERACPTPDNNPVQKGELHDQLMHNVGSCGQALEVRGREHHRVPVAPQWGRISRGVSRGGTPVQTARSSRWGGSWDYLEAILPSTVSADIQWQEGPSTLHKAEVG